jgi:DNA-binding response OmpR family regulator
MTSKSSRAPRLLLVEDEALIAIYERKALGALGFEIVWARSADEAYSRATSERFDLVLMDVDLGPGGDGISAAVGIRKASLVPILFLSSSPEDEVAAKASRVSGWSYASKGLRAEILAGRIAEILAGRIREACDRYREGGSSEAPGV